ncbi:MAG: ABC-F family ATP-binding cassette domain-containing protein [Bacteriovoracaceae bacterium]|nr:ABC-F family ATP-binding cassette domain-containing protein [Bacteriovoracaceae bacterium]
MGILCTLKNLNLSFGYKIIFSDARLSILHGDRIGLLGLNGTGKSSLFKILTETVSPDTTSPQFEFDKNTGKDGPQYKFSVFMVPQELPLEENDDITVKDYIYRFYPELEKIHNELKKIHLELEENHENANQLIQKQKSLLEQFEHLDGWRLSQNFESYLKLFHINNLEAKVRNLSGGEQKKILLSLGFSSHANLILWDEPTNHVDIDTIKLYEEELLGFEKTFMIVTHDRHLLGRVANKIFHLKNGKIERFDGNYTAYLEFLHEKEEERQKLVTRLENTLRREDAWMRQGIKARGTRSKKRVENHGNLKKTITGFKRLAKEELNLAISHSQRQTKKLIQFNEISFSYTDKGIFNDLSFTIWKKDKIGLLGQNGIGKTTLLNLICGNLSPQKGDIKKAEHLLIQHFTQKRDELDPEKTPFELIGDGNDHVKLPDGRHQHVISYFESFLFKKGEVHRPIKTFSGGERNRLQMALNLKRAGDLLIFDEPTNDLDLETLELLEKKLSDFDGSLILISHDRTFLDKITNKIWLIREGGLEKFDAGYSQVEPWLETLMLENELIEKQVRQNPVKKQSEPQKKRALSNKEKIRLKTIDSEIMQAENELISIEDELAEFDFSSMDDDKRKRYSELSQKKEKSETELLELYEEMETLKEL